LDKADFIFAASVVCGIFTDGKLTNLAEQPDPRIAFCESFDKLSADFGYTARPLDAGEAAAAKKLLAGKAVDQ
jgi:hypothetical protein